MLDGIHLTLLIGPAVPLPAPKVVMDALLSLQISESKDRTGFQLTFGVSKDSRLLKIMLPAGFFDPITTRVIVIVTVNGFPNVLMDGMVTRQELTPSSEPGQSTLTITGEDLSVLMDLVELPRLFPNMPVVARVYMALGPYGALGIVPLVIPPIVPTVDLMTFKIKSQPLMTDRAFIRKLANQCGYVFYVEPGPAPGQNIAYFGPDIRLPVPQHALNINMDAWTNVESLSFSLDGLAKKVRVYTILDPATGRVPILTVVPNINIFKPPLGLRPTPPARIEFAKFAADNTPDEAATNILGDLMNTSDAISATGSLDVMRYGHVLRSRLLVGVRGAGLAYDGLYYVDSVTHSIKRGQYKQNFNLSRDGLISITPKVLP